MRTGFSAAFVLMIGAAVVANGSPARCNPPEKKPVARERPEVEKAPAENTDAQRGEDARRDADRARARIVEAKREIDHAQARREAADQSYARTLDAEIEAKARYDTAKAAALKMRTQVDAMPAGPDRNQRDLEAMRLANVASNTRNEWILAHNRQVYAKTDVTRANEAQVKALGKMREVQNDFFDAKIAEANSAVPRKFGTPPAGVQVVQAPGIRAERRALAAAASAQYQAPPQEEAWAEQFVAEQQRQQNGANNAYTAAPAMAANNATTASPAPAAAQARQYGSLVLGRARPSADSLQRDIPAQPIVQNAGSNPPLDQAAIVALAIQLPPPLAEPLKPQRPAPQPPEPQKPQRPPPVPGQ